MFNSKIQLLYTITQMIIIPTFCGLLRSTVTLHLKKN